MIKLPDFILIPYQLLEDDSISLIDERLYGIIYWFTKLKMEKCTASNKTLAELVKTTPTTIQNSLTKLESVGYIQRVFSDKSRRRRKEIIPLITFSKVSPTDDTEYHPPVIAVSPTGDQNKNNIIRKDNKNNKHSENKFSQDGSLIIKEFEIINPAIKRMYGNTTQRRACDDLIESYGLDRVINVVRQTLPKTNKLQYLPTITTPLQLFQKWSALEAGIYKLKEKKPERYIA